MDHSFSAQTKELISKSREVAIELRTPYISSLHLFLADCILSDQQSALLFAFESTDHFKKYYADFKAAQEIKIPHFTAPDPLPLTQEAERIIKIVAKDQLQHKYPQIMPFHVISAAVRQNDSELVALLRPKENLYSKLISFYTSRGLKTEPSSIMDRVKDFFNAPESKTDINAERVSMELPKTTNAVPPAYNNIIGDNTDDKVEMILSGLAEAKNQNSYAVVFNEKNGTRKVPIIIGAFEAQALSIVLEKMATARPLTHQLFQQTIMAMGYTIKESIIHSLIDEVFHASILLFKDDHLIEQDARPSDAITMATMFNVPIYFNSKVLEEVKMPL